MEKMYEKTTEEVSGSGNFEGRVEDRRLIIIWHLGKQNLKGCD